MSNGVQGTSPTPHRNPPIFRHRDILLKATQFDCDDRVHDLLIRKTSAFLDQGFASWSIPERENGFYHCFLSLFAEKSPWTERWLHPLKSMIANERSSITCPIESIAMSLEALGVLPATYERYIKKTLLALPGWTGMVEQMSSSASWTLHPAPKGSLEEFLAVRLILDRLSAADCIQANRPSVAISSVTF